MWLSFRNTTITQYTKTTIRCKSRTIEKCATFAAFLLLPQRCYKLFKEWFRKSRQLSFFQEINMIFYRKKKYLRHYTSQWCGSVFWRMILKIYLSFRIIWQETYFGVFRALKKAQKSLKWFNICHALVAPPTTESIPAF